MLKSARYNKKLTQKELAAKLNISQSYLCQLENKNRYNKNVTIDLIKRISKELELDPIEVFIYFLEQK